MLCYLQKDIQILAACSFKDGNASFTPIPSLHVLAEMIVFLIYVRGVCADKKSHIPEFPDLTPEQADDTTDGVRMECADNPA
jgi:hypothetical protein